MESTSMSRTYFQFINQAQTFLGTFAVVASLRTLLKLDVLDNAWPTFSDTKLSGRRRKWTHAEKELGQDGNIAC